MQYLVIVLSALLGCTKVTIYGYLAKGNIKNSYDSVIACCLTFAFTCLIFSGSIQGGINMGILFYALLFGVFSALFQIFYALALKSGPFSVTCMLVNLNMILPIIFSLIFFDEKLTLLKVIGLILCFLALFLNTKGDGRKINIKWFMYVVFAFLSTGFLTISQKAFAKSQFADNVEQFVFLGYSISFLITAVTILVQNKAKQPRNLKLTKKNVLLIALVAASLGAYQYVFTYANSFVPAIVLTPSVAGLVTIFQMISGKIVFKDKFTLKQILSMCIGVIAILVVSM